MVSVWVGGVLNSVCMHACLQLLHYWTGYCRVSRVNHLYCDAPKWLLISCPFSLHHITRQLEAERVHRDNLVSSTYLLFSCSSLQAEHLVCKISAPLVLPYSVPSAGPSEEVAGNETNVPDRCVGRFHSLSELHKCCVWYHRGSLLQSR